MWKATGGTVEIDDEGIILNSAKTTNMGFYQYFENYLPAGVYTISAMFRDDCPSADCRANFVVTNQSDTVLVDRVLAGTPGSIVSWTFTAAEGVTIRSAGVYTTAAYAPRYRALKLELGDQQTLGHQDSAGNWVLNEIPSYADTLRECLRYLYIQPDGVHDFFSGVLTGSKKTLNIPIMLPAPMRTTPSLLKPPTITGVRTTKGENTTPTVTSASPLKNSSKDTMIVITIATGTFNDDDHINNTPVAGYIADIALCAELL